MNSCQFVGAVHKMLGAKKTNSGIDVCRFMIKTKEQKGETFVMIQAWRALAETAKTLKENDLVSVEASYNTSSYEDKNGKKQYSHLFNFWFFHFNYKLLIYNYLERKSVILFIFKWVCTCRRSRWLKSIWFWYFCVFKKWQHRECVVRRQIRPRYVG